MQHYSRTTTMSDIPTEGDAYNAQRMEDIYAAITNRATLARRYAELVRDPKSTPEQLIALTEAMAQVERDIPRLSQELAVSVQGRNLSVFLDRMEGSLDRHDLKRAAEHRESMTALGEVAARLGKTESRLDDHAGLLSDFGETLSETNSKVEQLDTRVGALEDKVELLDATIQHIGSEVTELRTAMTMIRFWQDDNPPPPEIAEIMKRLQDADQ